MNTRNGNELFVKMLTEHISSQKFGIKCMIELTVVAAELVLIGTCISAGYLIPVISKWTNDSGLATLDIWLGKLNIVTLVGSVIAVCGVHYYMTNKTQGLAFLIAFPLGVLMTAELFYGLTMWVDPVTYIKTLYDSWEMSINTPEIATLKRKFSCCGFHNLGNFDDKQCPSRRLCANVIGNALNECITSTGFLFLVHSLAHLIVIVIVFHSSGHIRKKDRRLRCRLDDTEFM